MSLRLRSRAFVAMVGLCGSVALSSTAAESVSTAARGEPARDILWRDPGPVRIQDLRWGIGSAARAPRGPFRFREEDAGGTQAKVVVTDAQGDVWDVKFGPESRAEVAANRLVWVFGYLTEEMYFVRDGIIEGAPQLDRAAEFIGADGRFTAGRFKRRDPQAALMQSSWAFDQNPFAGTRELSGLVILMTMICNWDIDGPRNNRILRVVAPDGSVEHWHIVGDLGASFGRMGGRLTKHSKWRLADFLDEGFIERVNGAELELDYDGLDSGLDRVPIEHARWFAGLASRLTEDDFRRVFDAVDATPAERDGFAVKLSQKVAELGEAVALRESAR